MSTKNAYEFFQTIQNSEDVRSQLQSASDENEYVERVVEIAGSRGYQVTGDDVRQCLKEARGESAELTDEQLETVAGGAWTDGWCFNLTLATGRGSACDPFMAGPDGQGDMRTGPTGPTL